MREIIPNLLWIGNTRDAHDVKNVHDLGISAVIDLALEEPAVTLTREIIYCRLPLIDGAENQPVVLKTAVKTVARLISEGVPTLVACSAGMSRSPAIVAAALSLVRETDFVTELKRLAEKYPADVAPGLWNSLQELLQQK
ncbi:dual specificity protein phosphatase family protein [Gimesia sp.]|uniref:dual specificity protein phosphatase family protein n=1 Tax=Gimesia sp. TaxID=2024833 RepID=UPI003A954919